MQIKKSTPSRCSLFMGSWHGGISVPPSHCSFRDDTQTTPKAKQMAKRPKKTLSPKSPPPGESLKGWQQIASFLGHPLGVVQRWAKTGMPVHREGRYVTALPGELNQWLGHEIGEPTHVSTERADLSSELKRGLSYVRKTKR